MQKIGPNTTESGLDKLCTFISNFKNNLERPKALIKSKMEQARTFFGCYHQPQLWTLAIFVIINHICQHLLTTTQSKPSTGIYFLSANYISGYFINLTCFVYRGHCASGGELCGPVNPTCQFPTKLDHWLHYTIKPCRDCLTMCLCVSSFSQFAG